MHDDLSFMHNLYYSFRSFLRRRMLPNRYNFPTFSSQIPLRFLITFPICINFRLPKAFVAFWCRKMFRATMPEASVNENYYFWSNKHQITPAVQTLFWPIIDPITESRSVHDATYPQFRLCIFSPISAHYLFSSKTRCRRESIFTCHDSNISSRPI